VAEETGTRDWYDWHAEYDRPDSALARRLAAVRERIGEALDAGPAGRLRVISLCAGQGRDLLGVLATHPRRHDVTALLVERDPRNAGQAARAAEAAGLRSVEVRVGDAALTDGYAGLVPADLVLMCGIFGNISDADVRATVGYASQLCATGGIVVWTRHRRSPDLVPPICGWFAEQGFEQRWLSEPGDGFGLGVHRFTRRPRPLEPGARMFTFIPDFRSRE
jgi:hypothetical protein